MYIKPEYNVLTDRPGRWSYRILDSGEFLEELTFVDNRFLHYTEKSVPFTRKISPRFSRDGATLVTLRKEKHGFLTAQYRCFHEDGKYLEVWNDPINFITTTASDEATAYIAAEQRIGNYRIGARRYITHLGGTIDIEQLDDLSTVTNADFYPTGTLSFPFFPPKPSNYTQAERVHLLTTDAGYVNYLKSVHPSLNNNETFLGEQGTGFRRFIYAADSQTTYSGTLTSGETVDISDIETVLDAAISADVKASGITTFLPVSGEDITVNIAGQHIIRSNASGFKVEMYSDATLQTLTTSIDIPKASGNIILTAGNSSATLTKDGSWSVDANGTTFTVNNNGLVDINAGSNNLTITAATVAITGNLTVSQNLDVEGTTDLKGITKHGV